MYHSIKEALRDRYVMFYHPSWPGDQLTPTCDLDQSIKYINDNLINRGRNLYQWSAWDQDQIARLLWVNWIYHDLKNEPIRKPILTHREGTDLIVDCGDTRLMALDLLDTPTLVKVLVTDLRSNADFYKGWSPVTDDQELLELIGFSKDSHITFNAVDGLYAIDWLEIGDQSTAHHLHDVDQRTRMIQNYIFEQDNEFQFDRSWFTIQIDWKKYDR